MEKEKIEYGKGYLNGKTGRGPFWIDKGAGKPNIFLITMDMVPPRFYLGEHRGIDTPNMDSLGNDSIFFSNAFASAPLCGPSRASYLTGRYSYITGNSERSHDGHLTELRNSDTIWPEYLKAAGYYTRHVGKSHVGTEIFTRVFGENDTPWHRWSPPWYDDEYYLEFLHRMGLQKYSFKKEIKGVSWSGVGLGNNYGGWLADQNGRPFPEDGTYPAFLVDRAISIISNRPDSESPLYFQLDFFGPHQPFAIPGGWEERERQIRESMVPPKSWSRWAERGYGEIKDQPRVYNLYRKNWGLRDREVLVDYMVANQLQFELMDRMVGKFIDFLKAENLYDESLIILTADHGEMNGEWGCIDKGAYLNPQVLRVPVIIKLPRNSNHPKINGLERRSSFTFEEPCSLLDIAPTILDTVGVEIPNRLDGFCLLDTAPGEKRPSDKPIMFDVWNHVVPNPSVGIVFRSSDGRFYMFSYNTTDYIDELYDLSPGASLNNLYGNPEYQAVYEEALRELNRCLSQDERWDVYRGYFQLEMAEKLKLPSKDMQKFV